ncbi:MAG: hypothetical protein HQL48_06660 [Gammaproteobacteria bacterium]|nr:hypothetical protein [Gammaproteobacteria bacterium]
MKLSAKFNLILSSTLVVGVVIITLVGYFDTRSDVITTLGDEALLVIQAVEATHNTQSPPMRQQEVAAIITSLLKYPYKLASLTSFEADLRPTAEEQILIQKFKSETNLQPFAEEDGEEQILWVWPILDQKGITAVHLMRIPQATVSQLTLKRLEHPLLAMGIFLLTLILVLTIFWRRVVTQRVEDFAYIAEMIRRGEEDLPPFDDSVNDELGELADSLNRIRISLQKALHLLEQGESDGR